jgi:hypothetical protein
VSDLVGVELQGQPVNGDDFHNSSRSLTTC